MLKSWSSSQTTLALPSGETELYALTKAAVQITGMISMAKDFGIVLNGVIHSDSNAAIGIVHRTGLGGRCRHINVQYLWIQGKVRNKELEIKKVWGGENPADLMTKGLAVDLLDKHMTFLGFGSRRGRSDKAVSLQTISNSDFWLCRGLEDKLWIRIHRKPRRCMFTPMKVANGPKRANDVGKYRLTIIKVGEKNEADGFEEWCKLAEPHRSSGGPFVGATICMNSLEPESLDLARKLLKNSLVGECENLFLVEAVYDE